MRAGQTFVLQDKSVDEHLWAVISEPSADRYHVVIVNVTSHKADKDCSCVLESGDHDFIRHRSVVNYGEARDVPNDKLDGLASAGQLILQEPLRPEILAKIREGAARSEFIPEGCRKILFEQGLIEYR